MRTRRPRRRASTLSLDDIVLPEAPPTPEAPKVTEPKQQKPAQENLPFKGWKIDQERWVKETGRWGR